MESIGLFEAKNRLSALVDRASKGEQITITRRGESVAMLVPLVPQGERSVAEIVAHIRESRKGVHLPDDLDIKRLIDEGRRF